MLTDFQNFFTFGLSDKFATNFIKISYHTLTMSLHYLVKYLCSKNRHPQEALEANGQVRLSHPKNSSKIFVW